MISYPHYLDWQDKQNTILFNK